MSHYPQLPTTAATAANATAATTANAATTSTPYQTGDGADASPPPRDAAPLLDHAALAKGLLQLMDRDEEERAAPASEFGMNLPDQLRDFAVRLDCGGGGGGGGGGGEGAAPPTCPGVGHPMAVVDTHEAFACDECGALGEGERWHCSKCKADFCWSCRPAPTGATAAAGGAAGGGAAAGDASGADRGTSVELNVGSSDRPPHGLGLIGLTLTFRHGSAAYRCVIPPRDPGEAGGAPTPTLTRLAKAPPRRGDLLPPTDKAYPLRTARDGDATMLTMANESSKVTVGVYWIDRAGAKHKYAELKPNTS